MPDGTAAPVDQANTTSARQRPSGPRKRRIVRNTKGVTPRVNKTDRVELKPIQRAQAVILWLHSSKSQPEIAEIVLGDRRKQPTIAKVIQRAKQRAVDLDCELIDPRVYENKPGRGRPEIVRQDPHDDLIDPAITHPETREHGALERFDERSLYTALMDDKSPTCDQ